jgi:quercetin dioxygenase-like cupin family protein
MTIFSKGETIMKMQLVTIILTGLLVPAIAQEGIKRTPLGTIDFPPGYQTVMGFADIAPNTCGGRHTHPGIETSYILEGEDTLKIDGQPDKPLKAGDSVQIPAGVVHDGCTSSGVKVLTVHVIEKGKPLASPAP